MNKAAKKKDYLLQHGLELVSLIGLTAISIGALAEKAGVSKSGLFAHFGSKEELQIALLEHSAAVASEVVVSPTLAAPEGLPRLQSLVTHWFGWPRQAQLPGGCPVAAAMFEMDDIENPVKDKVVEMNTYWTGFLTKLVEDARILGHLAPDLDVDQFVWELCGIYLAHHVSQRFSHDPKVHSRTKTAIDSLILRYRPQ